MPNFNLRTPHATVLIWNYDERLSANKSQNIDAVSQLIINSLSLMSIATTKEKSSPAGSCEITLAPFKNWINSITPGSWMAILIGNDPITKDDFKIANPNNFKFLGRVQSVRATVSLVDGARQTFYKVQCTEWCDIFNSTIYIDPVARDPNASAIGNATRLQYEKYLQQYSLERLFTPARNIEVLLKLLGESTRATARAQTATNLVVKPEIRYRFPKDVAVFLGLISPDAKQDVGPEVASAIKLVTGSLMARRNGDPLGVDRYNGFQEDSVGLMRPDSVLGSHSLWQLLNDNNNYIINELISEIRWEDGKPQLTLYNRVKPFLIRNSFENKEKINQKMISRFNNLSTIHIDENLILSANIGNNWRDKINFIEIQVDPSLFQQGQGDQIRAQQKLDSQSSDPVAFAREGFRPMILATNYFAPSSRKGGIDIQKTNSWKYLVRQWFFDNHRMLNGAITIKGMTEYIPVGTNIRFTTGVISPTHNTNPDDIKNREMYVLAHVESISHETSRAGESRSFTTTINFVRGVIVDKNNSIVTDGYLSSRDTNTSIPQERNLANTISTSAVTDPDPQKVRGR